MRPRIPEEEWRQLRGAAVFARRNLRSFETTHEIEKLRGLHHCVKIIEYVRTHSEVVENIFGHDGYRQFVTGFLTAFPLLIRDFERKLSAEQEGTQRLLEIVIRSVRMLTEVVFSLVFWADRRHVKTRSVRFKSYVLKLIKYFEQSFQGKLDIQGLGELSDTLRVRMHTGMLMILLMNMCSNAANHGKASQLLIRISHDGEMLQLEIMDDGHGFSEEDRLMIFRFFAFRKNGRGLGLAYADERMAIMDGEITAEGHEGLVAEDGIDQGAKFTIRLQMVTNQLRLF